MPVVLEHSPESPADDDLIPADLLGEVQGYLAARAWHVLPPQRSVEAWHRFYGVCNNYIRRTAAACGTRPADLDDCVQQVWADLLISLPRFAYDCSRGGFRAFLATLAHSKSTDLIRQRVRHPVCNLCQHLRLRAGDQTGPEEACEHAEELRQLRVLLLWLCHSTPSPNFRIFYRRCIMDQPTEKVAAKVHLSPEQVRFRLHRVRRMFRKLIARDPAARTVGGLWDGWPWHRQILRIMRNGGVSCADLNLNTRTFRVGS